MTDTANDTLSLLASIGECADPKPEAKPKRACPTGRKRGRPQSRIPESASTLNLVIQQAVKELRQALIEASEAKRDSRQLVMSAVARDNVVERTRVAERALKQVREDLDALLLEDE